MAEQNYKGQLIRHCDLSGLSFRFTSSETGPPHDPSFTSYVFVNNERCGEGQDKTKRAAENLACKMALLSLQNQEQRNHELAHQATSFASPDNHVVLNPRAVVTRSLVNRTVSDIMLNANYVGLFIEFCKKSEWLDFTFVDEHIGPSHMPEFLCSAVVGERKFPGARGKSKKEAKQNAAHVALKVLKQEYPEDLQLQQIPGLDDVEEAEERNSKSGRSEDNSYRSTQRMEIEPVQSENSNSQNMSCSSVNETPLLSRRPNNSDERSSRSTQEMEIEALESEHSDSQSMSCSLVSGTTSGSSKPSNSEDSTSLSTHGMEIDPLRSDSSDFQIIFCSSASGTPLEPSRPHNTQDKSSSMHQMETESLQSEHHDSKIKCYSPVSGTSSISRRPRKRFKLAPYFRNHDPIQNVTTEDKSPVNTGNIKPPSESRLHKDKTHTSELKPHSSDLAPLNVQRCENQAATADSGGDFLTSSSGISSNSNGEQSPLAAFDNITYLDEGGFAEVVKARKKMDEKYYAVKIVDVQDKNALQEVKALARLEHENIVRYYNAWFGPKYLSESGKRSSHRSRLWNYLYIQMELCENGSLKTWIMERNSQNKVNKSKSLQIFCQIVEGVTYIHSRKFIHRDLKPENILFTKDMVVKIGDFGLVTRMTSKEESEALERTYKTGTPTYMAPEQKGNKYENKVDIYALGLILFELLWIFHSGHERGKHWNNIRKGRFPSGFEDQYPSEIHEISKMLSYDPKKRPLAEDLAIFFARVKTVSSQSL